MASEDPASLAFRARALAQAHALSAAAHRIVNRVVAEEARTQPRPELGAWAGAALTQGYCLRRVQEDGDTIMVAGVVDDEVLDRAGTAHAAELRSSTGDELTVAALDMLVGSQVEHRLEPWRDELDDDTWAELEQYLTWWVVKGYGLRIAETSGSGP
ncbi:MAG: hypothetical protein H0V69_09220 [Acidimicrobiia bacterium]|nr:hypothetical protein [Acidimicrobiia bacterium]